MDLADLDKLYWVLIYLRGIVATTVVSSMSSGWVCLFRAFVSKVAGVITVYTKVICLISLSFDIGQLL